MQPISGAVVLSAVVSALVSVGVRADLWPKEGVLLACMTQLCDAVSDFIDDRIAATKAGWLPTSFGAWLTWLALYMYGAVRTSATFASGQLTLTNGGGGLFNFAPFTVTLQNPTTKKTYTNVDPIALAPGPGTSQSIAIQANELGSASNSAPGQISGIVSTMLNVTCSNAAPVLGIDQQSDPSLQLLCWNAIAANSAYGPRQSFAYAIQTAINPLSSSPVNINRWLVSQSSHTGYVTVLVASPQGAADPNDVAGVGLNVEAIARPMCVGHAEQSAVPVPYTQAINVYVTATPGLSQAAVTAAMNTALNGFFQSYPIQGKTGASGFQGVFASAIEGAIASAWPPRPLDPTIPWQSAVFDIELAAGGDLPDLALGLGQVATNGITINVILV